jgi:hypothetical protein
MPVPTLRSFVEENPEQYYCSSLSDKSTESSRSSSVGSCFSAASSPLSSRPTTPGLEVIDPRILEPLEVHKEHGCQLYDQDSMQTSSLEMTLDGHDIKNQSFDDAAPSQSHIRSIAIQPTFGFETSDLRTFNSADYRTEDAYQPCDHVANQLHSLNLSPNKVEVTKVTPTELQNLQGPSTSFTANKVNEEKKHSRNDRPIFMPGNGICSAAENEHESHSSAHQELTDEITPHDGDSIINLKKPLTRAQARQRPIQHFSKDSTREKPRQKLNSTEKRKLRELKSQNWTLRQIGPHFADIDTICLRQAWYPSKDGYQAFSAMH